MLPVADMTENVIADNFGKILATQGGAIALGLLLAQILWKIVSEKILKNGNGAATAAIAENQKVLIELASSLRQEREAQHEYRKEGYKAVFVVKDIPQKFDKLTDAIREQASAMTRLADRLDRK